MAADKIPDPIDRHVGARVRMRRMLRAVSQERLGEALGVTFQQVQKYEKGTNRISASRLQQIAEFLGVEVAFFFDGSPRRDMSGVGEGAVAAYIVEDESLMSTTDGVKLVKAFLRIKDPRVRKQLVDIANTLAGPE